MPDSAAGWRIEPPVSVPIPNGTWYAATAAAEPPLLPAGHRVEVPRVADRPERRALVRRAHRELVHVRLAEEHRAGVAQALGDVGVVRRDVALEDPRARRALAAGDRDEVLERDRHARAADGAPRPRPAPRARAAASRASAASACASAVSRSIDEPGVERAVLALGDLEVRQRQLARRDLARAQPCGERVPELRA